MPPLSSSASGGRRVSSVRSPESVIRIPTILTSESQDPVGQSQIVSARRVTHDRLGESGQGDIIS